VIKKLPAYRVYLITSFSLAVFFSMMGMISAIYRVQSAGLNPLQLVLVGAVLEASVFLFEAPTGVVADLRSRRLSVIIGYVLVGLGFILEGAFPLFLPILLAQVTWGLGYTFTSGAWDAWLADEIGEERLTQAYLRGAQMQQAGALLGIGGGVLLGRIALGLPIIVGGACIVGVALFLALFMPETGFTPTPRPERTTWQKMGDTFREGLDVVRARPLLLIMMSVMAIYGLSSEGLDRLWEAHFLANFSFPTWADLDAVTWFGLINVVVLLLGIAAAELVRRRVNLDGQAQAAGALFVTNGIMIASLVVFGLAGNFALAAAAYWSTAVFRRVGYPLYSSWINRELESGTRATVLSVNGQMNAIGQIVGGPIIGAVATGLGLRAAMVGVAVMLAPVLFLFLRARRLGGPEQASAPAG
jgi:DHA3 family tetracycline resistance protein-like MFS transporter